MFYFTSEWKKIAKIEMNFVNKYTFSFEKISLIFISLTEKWLKNYTLFFSS